MNLLIYFFKLIQINLKSSMSLRGAFLSRLSFMVINNILMFLVWVIFFERFKSLNGWGIEHVAIVQGMVCFSYSFLVLGFNGLRSMSYMIDEGGVDVYLTQPKPVVLGIAGKNADASGFGEMATGIILFCVGGTSLGGMAWWLPVFVLLGALFWVSICLFVGSLSFWFKEMKELSGDIITSVIVLATQPQSIFTGYFKLIIFTVMPVAYISYLPVSFFINHEIGFLLGAMAGTIGLFLLSLFLFHRGLKNYESGNRFGVQG